MNHKHLEMNHKHLEKNHRKHLIMDPNKQMNHRKHLIMNHNKQMNHRKHLIMNHRHLEKNHRRLEMNHSKHLKKNHRKHLIMDPNKQMNHRKHLIMNHNKQMNHRKHLIMNHRHLEKINIKKTINIIKMIFKEFVCQDFDTIITSKDKIILKSQQTSVKRYKEDSTVKVIEIDIGSDLISLKSLQLSNVCHARICIKGKKSNNYT